jgi:hypothetical protein
VSSSDAPLSSFLTPHTPPLKRQKYCENGIELKLSEAAVQLAFALHLLNQPDSGEQVEMFPDGEHAKRFDIPAFLRARGYERVNALGATQYGGEYFDGLKTLVVNPKSQHGRGDVVGKLAGVVVRAECKGGIINSKHSGALSKVRSGFNELIGQTMSMPEDGSRHVAVAPRTPASETQASRLLKRCAAAGIEIALVDQNGQVEFVAA